LGNAQALRAWRGRGRSARLQGQSRNPGGRSRGRLATAALTAELVAPLAPDQVVGEIEVRLGEARIATRPLVTLAEVKRGFILSRIADSIALWFD
jgi:D-alanyl-D-alanine carboxypeptidase